MRVRHPGRRLFGRQTSGMTISISIRMTAVAVSIAMVIAVAIRISVSIRRVEPDIGTARPNAGHLQYHVGIKLLIIEHPLAASIGKSIAMAVAISIDMAIPIANHTVRHAIARYGQLRLP